MENNLLNLKDYLLTSSISHCISSIAIERGELVLITTSENILPVFVLLKDEENCLFDQLLTICGADYPNRKNRFEVIYHLLSMRKNLRIRVKVITDKDHPTVTSLTPIFRAANWYEREIWDLYGIKFEGHPDLKRILTDYGFEGHPLRKDFPLTGHVEVRYDLVEKKVIYQPVNLTQEFRNFDFSSPWVGTEYVLPGDEKINRNNQ